jgi:LPLT family lysophospholipid transporter-like MFS transporter
MLAVLGAQFFSAIADNALLFASLALLKAQLYPQWSQPLLQESFVAAYILLAPFTGPLADAWPKGHVMLLANGAKLCGAVGLLAGLNPFLAYGIVGVGAAMYAPAKYGILSEITAPAQLVKANGLIESSTIAAILLGAILGGTLADWSIQGAFTLVVACYALAAAINLLVPRLAPVRLLATHSPIGLLRNFGQVVRKLAAINDARFSVAGTSLFWGAGSTTRFMLVAWVPVALGVANNRMPAYLNGVVAIGIIAGAVLAARFVTLGNVNRALTGGVVLGIGFCALAATTSLPLACIILALVGAGGGFMVVPFNALLQQAGYRSVGAGQAIAVQNLFENTTMLLMIGAYTLLARSGMGVTTLAAVFGGFLCLSITGLWWYRVKRQNERAANA